LDPPSVYEVAEPLPKVANGREEALEDLRRLIATRFPECEVVTEMDVGRGPELLVSGPNQEKLVQTEEQLRQWFGPRAKTPPGGKPAAERNQLALFE
jgi:hypothetical protein